MRFGEQHHTDIGQLTGKVVVLPVASLEQHGHHLPLLTDSLICEAIVRGVEAELGDRVLCLPLLWVGASEHHRSFPGTVSIPPALFVSLLAHILECLVEDGFRRIFVLNAHGGNDVPGRQALLDVMLRHRDLSDLWLALGSYMDLAAQQIAALPQLAQKAVTHSCELETSLILHLRPELVRLEKAAGANIPFGSAFYAPDFSRPSRVYVPREYTHLSTTGAFGHPESGTAEKGQALLYVIVKEVAAFLREFAEWQPHKPG
jgi:creatinine amidohydrolase